MSQISEAIHNHHQEMLNTLTNHVTALVEGLPEADPRGLVTFLTGDLLPHAVGEEQHMYPAVDPLVRTYGRPTATMSVDHEFIQEYIRHIQETVHELETAAPEARPAVQARLNRLSLKIEAIFQLHLEKEERVYIPLFEKYLPVAEQQRILDGMHETYDGAAPAAEPITLDVRPMPPARRHSTIFETFAQLDPGAAFVLVNDHDPKPLYYQFKVEHAGEFTWDYLEQGPEVWRVRIGKTGAAPTATVGAVAVAH
jgi:uncharacterized protein (DUF2249 family)/hemerythrin-like domain-containing protein